MADTKISQLTGATTPLAGTEVLPIVQSGVTKQVSVANLTAGRNVSVADLAATGNTNLGNSQSGITGGGRTTRFSGKSVTNGSGWYGTYGQCIWDANTEATASARRFAFVNGINYTNFGLIRSVDANTDPALNGNGGTVSSGTLDWSLDTSGNITNHTGNLIVGTAAKGVNFTANTPAAGMTSQLLNWYEEGTWTPANDSMTVNSGSWAATGTYTRIGRTVFFSVVQTSGTVSATSGVGMISGFPYAPARPVSCTYTNSAGTLSGVGLLETNSKIYGADAFISQTALRFSGTYQV